MDESSSRSPRSIITSLVVAVLLTISAIDLFVLKSTLSVFHGIFFLLNIALILFSEFFPSDIFEKSTGFLYSNIGKGIYCILLGMLLLGWNTLNTVIGVMTIVAGV
ncbi:hypothetical protein BB559_006078, partial [Furculomyces boomerangus]